MTANGELVRDGIRYELNGTVMHVHLCNLGVKYQVDLPAIIVNINDAVDWYQEQIEKAQREVKLRADAIFKGVL